MLKLEIGFAVERKSMVSLSAPFIVGINKSNVKHIYMHLIATESYFVTL